VLPTLAEGLHRMLRALGAVAADHRVGGAVAVATPAGAFGVRRVDGELPGHRGPFSARAPNATLFRIKRAYCGVFLPGAPMPAIQQLSPIAALIAGVLILIMPKLLNYIIALYLIVIGLVGLFG